jgi:HTH-type transcriptional regulator, competence development regulator
MSSVSGVGGMSQPFGTVLRGLRRAKRMSLADVASRLNWSQPYLSDIETGRRNPPAPERVDEIARLLGEEGRAGELQRLAGLARGAVVLKLSATMEPEFATTFVLLGKLHAERRLRADTMTKIRRILEANTTVA